MARGRLGTTGWPRTTADAVSHAVSRSPSPACRPLSRSGGREPIASGMRRAIVVLLASVLVGCQGSDAGFYNGQAKDEAMRAAKNGPLARDGVVLSVESAEER